MDYVQEYGKQLMSELMDIMLISKKLSNEDASNLMLKYGYVKRKSTMIYADVATRKNYYGDGNAMHMLYIKNGRGTILVYIRLQGRDIQKILEAIE